MTQVRRGERLADRYEVLAEIGRGGMGAVHEAHDAVLDRRVAIKILNGTVAELGGDAPLEQEAKLAAKLDHPAIVPVYDFGRDNGRLFFVMPLVEGLTLRQMLVDGPLPQVVTVVIGRQVAEALAHSHARHVVHRDIKPENVMVGPGTDGPRVKVLDFGIATSPADAGEGKPRVILGTPDYLSPEQARGEPLDGRADVYSLGAVLYECCAGTPPFVAEDLAVLVDMVLRAPAPRVADRCPGITPALETIIHQCLEKDPADRPASAESLVELLSQITTKLRPVVQIRTSARPVMTAQSTLPAAPRIVGREEELERVRARLALAARSECQLLAIGGTYGVGKSAFASVVGETAHEVGLSVLRGRAFEDDVAPFGPIGEAFVGFFRGTASEEWFADDPDLVPQLIRLFPRLEGILAVRPDAAPPRTLSSRAETFEVIARAFAALTSQGRSALLVLEDVHAAPFTVEAVRYLFRRLAASSLAIVLTYRREDVGFEHPLFELRAALLGEPAFADIELRPLERPLAARLAAMLLPGARIESELADRLYDATGGNPLHLTELAASLRESGQLKVEHDAWTLVADANADRGEESAVPSSMRVVVGKRLQRLPAPERAVLEAGAIFGRSFAFEDVAALTGPATAEMLDRLVRRGLLTREDGGTSVRYFFPALLTADSVRDGLGEAARRDLHRRFAAHLVATRRTLGDDAMRVATHLLAAGDRARAMPYAVAAAKAALEARAPEAVLQLARTVGPVQQGAGAPAIEHELLVARAHARTTGITRAREIVGHVVSLLESRRPHRSHQLEELELESLRLAAELAWEERDRDAARDFRDRAQALARALGRASAPEPMPRIDESGTEWPVMAGRDEGRDAIEGVELAGERLLVQGAYLAARALLAKAEAGRAADGASAGSPEETVRQTLRSAMLAARLGSYDEADVLAQSARQEARSFPLAAEVDATLAQIHCARGRFELAWTTVQASFDKLGSTPADLRARALLLLAKGDASIGLSRHADAADAYDHAGRLLDPLVHPLEHSAAIFGSGDARIAAGQPDEAAPFFERAERQRLAIGDRWGLSRVHEGHARVCLCKGRLREARSHAERAVVLAIAIVDPKLTAMTRTRLGLVEIALGDLKGAASAFGLALRDAEGCGAEPEIAAALAGHAELCLLQEERQAAVEAAEQASRLATKLGQTPLKVSVLLLLARAGTDVAERARALTEASRLAEQLGNPFTALDVELARGIVLGDEDALAALVERAAERGAALHVAEGLLAQAGLVAADDGEGRATPLLLQASAVFAELGAAARAEATLARVA